MKKVLLLMALMVLTWGEAAAAADGDKQLVTVKRSLSGFERIELLGSIDVKYRQGSAFSVVVKAPREVVNDVKTRVVGHALQVNMKGEGKVINFGIADSDDVTVYVTSPDLIGVELKGSGDFDCEGPLDTDNLDLVVNGSGDIEFADIICDRLKASVVGSGDVEVKRLKALQTQIKVVGSGDVEMTFDNSGTVDAQLVGSGDIKLRGTVKELTRQKRGSGSIQTRGLTVKAK